MNTQTPERILQRLDWEVIRRLDGLLQAITAACSTVTVRFCRPAEYQPEDDVRYIDWNVTARMDTPYVRSMSKTARWSPGSCSILAHPSIWSGEAPQRGVLIDFVAILARLLTRHGTVWVPSLQRRQSD